MDLAITRAEAGDATAVKRARQTLDAAIALIDPVWGGVFQYSEAGSWTKAHFEKIMSFQAQYLRQYSQAYALWKDPKYLAAARDIERYLADFLTGPDGAFYVSQDADLNHDVDGHKYYALPDGERRKLGMPRIDKNLLRPRKRLGDFGTGRLLQCQQRSQGDRDRRAIGEMGDRQSRAAGRRLPAWRQGSRRSVHRRYAGDGAGLSRSLCRDRQPRMADFCRQGRRFRDHVSATRPAASSPRRHRKQRPACSQSRQS